MSQKNTNVFSSEEPCWVCWSQTWEFLNPHLKAPGFAKFENARLNCVVQGRYNCLEEGHISLGWPVFPYFHPILVHGQHFFSQRNTPWYYKIGQPSILAQFYGAFIVYLTNPWSQFSHHTHIDRTIHHMVLSTCQSKHNHWWTWCMCCHLLFYSLLSTCCIL